LDLVDEMLFSRRSGAPQQLQMMGVSIAKDIELDDPWEKIGAELLKR
jgi:hypothetical protein